MNFSSNKFSYTIGFMLILLLGGSIWIMTSTQYGLSDPEIIELADQAVKSHPKFNFKKMGVERRKYKAIVKEKENEIVVEYQFKDPTRRGGGPIVYIDKETNDVKKVMHGQ